VNSRYSKQNEQIMFQEDLWKCTGVDGYYYDSLCEVDDIHVRSYCQATNVKAVQLAKAWTAELATEWAMRNYLAVKMILASQLLLNVASYSQRKNVVLTQPYLLYYSLLNTCRAYLFSDITLDWRDGQLRTASHKAIRNSTINGLRRLAQTISDEANTTILKAKKQRELFSYSFPAEGLRSVPGGLLSIDDACRIGGLLCELAEANSECMESAWKKHSGVDFKIDWSEISNLCVYDAGEQMIDNDDYFRLSYLQNYVGPACLVSIARPGMIDDFFGAWCPPDDDMNEDCFDPDAGEAPRLFAFE
jgi:hypothetical protein